MGWRIVMILTLVFGHGSLRAGVLTISELYYDAVGPDDGLTFVELHGPAGMLLTDMVLEGVNGRDGATTHRVALDGYRIPPDRFLVLADGYAGGGTGVAEADYVIGALDFQNGPDSVRLLSGDAVLDAVGYGEFLEGDVFAGEGDPAPDAFAGRSLARWYADLDTNDNLRDFHVPEFPSPGLGPEQELRIGVPEPGSIGLLGVGLLGVALAARRRDLTPGRRRSRTGRRSS